MHSLTEKELKKEIEKHTIKQNYYIDSQIVINSILSELGNKHSFHRQFNELFPEMNKEQVLGMNCIRLWLMIVEFVSTQKHNIQDINFLMQHILFLKMGIYNIKDCVRMKVWSKVVAS